MRAICVEVKGGGEYFASSNTKNGFVSRFDSIFFNGEFDRILILKGGPGTGKSKLMKDVSNIMRAKGYVTEEFLCSSDIRSFDALIIPEIKSAIIDGTSPHMVDPIYPGAVDSIINLGEYWDTESLVKNTEKIKALAAEKQLYIKRAYKMLTLAGEAEGAVSDIISHKLSFDKMSAAAKRFFYNDIFDKNNNITKSCKIRLISAINDHGYIRTGSYESKAQKKCIIINGSGCGHLFLTELCKLANCENTDYIISYDSLCPERTDGILFPSAALSVTIRDDQKSWEKYHGIPYKTINMKRFTDARERKKHKNMISFITKLESSAIAEAAKNFKIASELHTQTEKIYISAMDFQKKEKLTDEIIRKLLNT